MFWVKYFITAILFYIFAVLQNSFLIHFNILGVIPNFVLIFYFLLLFFEKTDKFYLGIFGAFLAGFFLDVFSHHYFGISMLLLLAIMFAVKKILQLLWKRSDKYSAIYFASLFLLFLFLYKIFLNVADFGLDWKIFIFGGYNLFFALIGFFIFDKFNIFRKENKQLKLF